MKTSRFVKKIGDCHYMGIVKVSEWGFGHPSFVAMYKDFYVLGEWYDFHDGVKSNIEGQKTIGIFRYLEMAKREYDRCLKTYEKA